MKISNKIILFISLIIICILLYLLTNQKERYFKKTIFNEENVIQNSTNNKYLDTIIYSGLNVLDIKGITTIIIPLSKAPKQYFINNVDILAFIVLDGNRYYIFIDNVSREESIKILSHELIHLNQYYTGKLKINKDIVIWQKNTYKGNEIPYKDRPWEINAFNNENILLEKIESKLY